MTLVVITKATESDAGPPSRKGITQLLALTTSVIDGLKTGFRPETVRVWEEFPGTSLGGEQVHGPIRVEDSNPNLAALLPSADLRLVGESEGGTEPQFILQPHHAVEVTGRYTLDGVAAVPAWVHLNLYRPWADRAGDIVFDTSKTAAVPFDGFYQLLRSDSGRARPVLRKLMDRIATASKEVGGAARVRWASVKEVEGAEEPGFRSFLAQYRGYTTGRHSILSQALRDEALQEFADLSEPAAPALPEAFVSAVVEDMIREIAAAPAFDGAATRLEEGEGVEFVASGSGFYILPSPDAVEKVARRILSNLGSDLEAAVKERLGVASRWDKKLARLARSESRLR